jgi:hypothetical protein
LIATNIIWGVHPIGRAELPDKIHLTLVNANLFSKYETPEKRAERFVTG